MRPEAALPRLTPVRAAVVGLFLAFSSPASAYIDDPAQISAVTQAVLDGLKDAWPEVGPHQVVPGDALDLQDQEIRLGDIALRELINTTDDEALAVLTFTIAHEAWHSVQKRKYEPDVWRRLQATRILECEADFMAAVFTAKRIDALQISEEREQLSRVLVDEHLVRRQESVALYHPPPSARALTVDIGWMLAGTDSEDPGASSAWQDFEKIARDTCLQVVRYHDGSLGNISMEWSTVDLPGGRRQYELRASNASSRTIEIAFGILVRRYWRPAGEALRLGDVLGQVSEVSAIRTGRIVIAGRSVVEGTYPLESQAGADGRAYSTVELPNQWSDPTIRPSLITSRYLDEGSEGSRYCHEKIDQLETPSDRALFRRLKAIALTAPEDFDPIAGGEFRDYFGMRSTQYRAGLGTHDWDSILYSPGGAMARIIAFESSDEGAVTAEYARLQSLLHELCGTEDTNQPYFEATSDLAIRRFSPGSSITLGTFWWRDDPSGRDPDPELRRTGGRIFFSIYPDRRL